MKLPPVPRGALFFAPMEGVTDHMYRETVVETCPDWDVLACDFLRVPAAGHYPIKHLRAHMGERFMGDPQWLNRTMYQILSSEKSFTSEIARDLNSIGIPWVDMNLGCPSKTVCKSGGGSFLLTDLPLLARIVRDVRKNFHGRFSCKVRVGFRDGANFAETIRILNEEGVELITVHGRTREQMYKELSDWKWIAEAVKVSQVPIIGNGDVWTPQDATRLLAETGCHGVMVARGAMKTPWFAMLHKRNLPDTAESRLEMARLFIRTYGNKLIAANVSERGLVKQIKGITRYMLDELPGGAEFRREILLSQDSATIFSLIENRR